jgi:hypothetical protein
MAEGIADGVNVQGLYDGKADYSTTLMTYHSYNSSSTWFHNDQWIDFHMWGSYHAEINNSRSYELAIHDWYLSDPKPTINGEPNYEGHGINYAIDDNGYFTSTDVRLAAYWSAFSGAAGFTYGSQPVWQFTDEVRKKLSSKTTASWREGLGFPGAGQVSLLKKLMEFLLPDAMVPDNSIISGGPGNCGSYVCAIRGKSTAAIYIPAGNKITVRMGSLPGKATDASWFNPRTGEVSVIGEVSTSDDHTFESPAMSKELVWLRSGRGCDWVLILGKRIQDIFTDKN